MKMSMTFSVRISLLTLAVVMHFSASAGRHLGCCEAAGRYLGEMKDIRDCYKQEKGTHHHCHTEAYMIITEKNETFCVKPTPPWLKKIENNKINCSPLTSHELRRFLLLDVDDLKWLK